MRKDLIKIIEKNIQYLKNCLDLTEAHITWGDRSIKKKYSIIKDNILNKIKEQRIDKRHYENIVRFSDEWYNIQYTV
jgi:hypothetical protein